MNDDKKCFMVASSVVEKAGKYGFVLHLLWPDNSMPSEIIVESELEFTNPDDAKKAGSAVLQRGKEDLSRLTFITAQSLN